ncbi:hypothetical protein [Methylobacter psychrophilus]|uniref:hypothetical protein n=1 Tax=Methylobacter psychrophilus TaxID=96941 RepID=UPI0021D4C99B|nr:hypothetical protein [Methylobacter psychrophilus]
MKQTQVVDALDTANFDIHTVENKDNLIQRFNVHLNKVTLRRAIQFALAGSMLASGMASAVLLDHGPSDSVITFPQWYRDTEGLALGLCTSTSAFCFPLATNPAGFVGNIGDEAFYSLVEFKNTATGSDFEYRYLGALEASYLPGPTPKRGDETVFARIRITFNFNDVNKNGTYTITHPFGVHTFENVQATTKSNLQGSQAANFFTVDVPLGTGFDGALAGPLGPFIKWDTDLPLVSGAEEFVGDPTVPHTFTGSPFGTNFIRIQGPVGSNLDGLGNDFIEESLGNVLGQKWTAPIAQALKVDAAYKVRKSGINGVDVWATSTPDQRLIVTGEGMPSLQLFPSGKVAGKYHGHIEYPSTQAVPPQITVTNLSSNPVNSVSMGLKDGVEISQASFETTTRQILIVAHSSDEVTNPGLVVEGLTDVIANVPVTPPAITTAMTQAQCPATVTNPVSVCFTGSLPDTIEPPESISVLSTEAGFHADHLLSINGAPQNPANPPVATNIAAPGLTVSTGGSTALTGALPVDALIIKQPANGMIAFVNSDWIFTPNASAIVGTDSFKFVRQAANNAPVSNVATGNLTIAFNPTAPTAVADQFAASYAGTVAARTKTMTILGNDKRASANALDVINPASLTIVTQPTKGNLVKLASGQITYVTKTATATSGGADFFDYTVNNSSTPALTSNTVRVDITNFSAAEAVRVTSARYTIASGKWVVVGTTSWFGANLTQTDATCWTGTGAAPTSATLIGTVPVDNTGNFQLASVGTAPVGINNGALRCKTSNGGLAAGVTVAK